MRPLQVRGAGVLVRQYFEHAARLDASVQRALDHSPEFLLQGAKAADALSDLLKPRLPNRVVVSPATQVATSKPGIEMPWFRRGHTSQSPSKPRWVFRLLL